MGTEYSVVMTCWGHLEAVTSKCLPSFYERPAGDWELIVVDNHSPDGTADWLFQQRDEHPEVPLRVVALEENRGYAGGLNTGLELARGDRIVCMNNDIHAVYPGWLEVLFTPIEENPRRVCGPRLIANNAMTDVGYGPHKYLEGWTIAATREFWEEMGGWGDQYETAWFEDVDLSFRAEQAGYELFEVPDVPILHMFGMTAYRSGLDFHAITVANKRRFAGVVERYMFENDG